MTAVPASDVRTLVKPGLIQTKFDLQTSEGDQTSTTVQTKHSDSGKTIETMAMS